MRAVFRFRINRNIVECKVRKSFCEHLTHVVLIETLWNVKVIFITIIVSLDDCINRNIVECKESDRFGHKISSYRINRNIVECKDNANND